MKNVLIVDRYRYIHFLSATYEGKAHDKRIADESDYTLPDGSELYQDTGFQGFQRAQVRVIQPKKKPRGGRLTAEDKTENRRISSIRVLIEHAIGDVKRYRIVRDIIRVKCEIFRDMVMETCCGLHNFRIRYAMGQTRKGKP